MSCSDGMQYEEISGLTGDIGELRACRAGEQERLREALASRPLEDIAETLGGLHDAWIARALALAETEMARLGHGAPPVPYAYMLFGSGGRREQTFASDQDSGIVYANAATDEEDRANAVYFARFGETAVRFLIGLGYPPCEGNVIASNPSWRLSLRAWKERIDAWFSDPTWENVRYLLILADGRAVWGDAELADRVKKRFFSHLIESPVIVRRMIENTLRHKVLVGVFGQLLRERYGENAGGLDVKYGAYIPMVNVFRLLAVRAGIRETSTLGRIAALKEKGVLGPGDAEAAAEAFTFVLKLRLLAAAKDEHGQWISSGRIPKEQLTGDLVSPLKRALKFGKMMQRRVERELQDRYGLR